MVDVTLDTKRLQKAMKESPVRLYQELRTAIRNHHLRHHKAWRSSHFHAGKGGVGVQTRSSNLKDAFSVNTFGSDLNTLAVVTASAGSPYARIQEEGGTIKPTKSAWLTIPLDAAKTAGGQLRKPAKQWTDTFFRRSRKGNPILSQQRGKDIVPLFVLKKSVSL